MAGGGARLAGRIRESGAARAVSLVVLGTSLPSRLAGMDRKAGPSAKPMDPLAEAEQREAVQSLRAVLQRRGTMTGEG